MLCFELTTAPTCCMLSFVNGLMESPMQAQFDASVLPQKAGRSTAGRPPLWLLKTTAEFAGDGMCDAASLAALPLRARWAGRVIFAHPPEGEPPAMWITKAYRAARPPEPGSENSKLQSEIADSPGEIIMLLRVAADTLWFAQLCREAHALAFLRGRLRFNGQRRDTPYASLLAYFGPRAAAFTRHFEQYTTLALRLPGDGIPRANEAKYALAAARMTTRGPVTITRGEIETMAERLAGIKRAPRRWRVWRWIKRRMFGG